MTKLSKSLKNLFKKIELEKVNLEKVIEVPDFSEKDKKNRRIQYNKYVESIPKTLYHSTLVDSMDMANKNDGWMNPSRGSVVQAHYGGSNMPKPAKGIFMSDEEEGHGYYSLLHLKNKLGRNPTKEEFLNHAAIAYINPNEKNDWGRSIHSHITYRHEKDNVDGDKFIKPWANNPEDNRITHGSRANPERFMHVEPKDYFSGEPVKPFKWLHGKELHEDIIKNPQKYHKDVISLVSENNKISKSLKNLFKSVQQGQGEEVHFPEARELFDQARKLQPLGSEGSDEDYQKMDELNSQISQIIDHEKKHEWRKGEAEYNGRPVTIHQTWFGKAQRLKALVEDEDGNHHGVPAYRLKKIKFY